METKEMNDITVLRGGRVYDPEDIGLKDIVIVGTQISKVVDPLSAIEWAKLKYCGVVVEIIDCTGKWITPGFIDSHVHIIGGGGEMGFHSRTPEANTSELVVSGLTTVIGLLGTDVECRSLETLLAKVYGLRYDGIGAYMLIGGYRVPGVTLTGTIMKDIMLIEPVIGVGEIALNDHRGTNPTIADITLLAADCRVGAMLSNKHGIVHVHMGKGHKRFQDLKTIIKESEIPIQQFHPTHCNERGPELLTECLEWLDMGGYVDFTADDYKNDKHKCSDVLDQWKQQNQVLDKVTIATDAYGSFPHFNSNNELDGYGVGLPNSILETFNYLHTHYKWRPEEFVPLVTSHVAEVYGFKEKGYVRKGFDADLCVLDPESFTVSYLMNGGKWLKKLDWIKKGMFEK
ncbi:hypothetical protein HDV02_002733 [Globomyces sp. JEL0801]|nr:hypothetical protein HDV02_002733 [Globomyces sp. JEL0801]